MLYKKFYFYTAKKTDPQIFNLDVKKIVRFHKILKSGICVISSFL